MDHLYRDAAVAYESGIDLAFKNTLSHPIIIHQEVDYLGAGKITFEIFGHPDDRVNVEIGNAYSWIGGGSPTYVVDTSLAPGTEVVEDAGVNGLTQRAWRVWLDNEGIEIRIENLTSDRVSPVGAYIRHNPSGDGASGGTEESVVIDEVVDKPPPSSGAF